MTVFYHESYNELTQTPGHPESPERMQAILDMLGSTLPSEKLVEPEAASEARIAKVHDPDYIEKINGGEAVAANMGMGLTLNTLLFILAKNGSLK